MTISFPSCLIDVRIFVASEDETGVDVSKLYMFGLCPLIPNRSVIAKAERILPSNKGSSHRFCCSGVPYLARTSVQSHGDERQREGQPKVNAPMLPVSGAEQFTACEAM